MTSNRPVKIKRAPTSIDVAKAVGVSRATVEFVLNETPGQTISAATRQRVLKAVRALGYHPDATARTLRQGHSRQIAMLVRSAMRFTTGEWIAGLQGRASELRYHVAVYPREGLPDKAWRDLLAEVLSQHPAGIIAWAPLFKPAERKLLRERHDAVVYVSAQPMQNARALVFDRMEAGRAAAVHLAERGHRHIALARPRTLIFGEIQDAGYNLKGLRAILDPIEGSVYDLPMDATLEDARRVVGELKSASQFPTAALAQSGELALVLLHALQDSGLRVPADVALVSAEDSQVCRLAHPRLTCVGLHLTETARHVVDAIDALARGQELDPGLLIPPPPQLIVRESS